MKLRELCLRAGIEVADNTDIYGLSYDSRRTSMGDLFFSTNGDIDYINEAISRGAVAVVSDRSILGHKITNIVVSDVRKMMAIMSSIFYMDAHRSLSIIAVTGTNGKTTVADQLYKLGNSLGYKCGLIGTLGAQWGQNSYDTGMTTPDSVVLHMILSLMKNDGVRYVFMEASAHSIYLDKLYGIKFDTVVFTNLSQDHLDFFHNLDNYKRAKLSLFSDEYATNVVVNTDDEVGREIYHTHKDKSIGYALYNPADIFGVDINFGEGTSATLNIMDEIYHLKTRMIGLFNVYNIMAILGVSRSLGWDMPKCIEILAQLPTPEGRFCMITNDRHKVVVDYAHTPDAIANVLRASTILGKRKIVVFGCGGDRDTDKRSQMGMLASKYADIVILTEDNSRSEDVLDIICDIARGIVGDEYIIIPSRKYAIETALNISNPEDIILILGKGAEKYIEKNGSKITFSDIEYVHKLLKE